MGGGARRERFVFRPIHHEILEQSFAEEAYPSFERREESFGLVTLQRRLSVRFV